MELQEVQAAIADQQVAVSTSWGGGTLMTADQLPFPMEELDTFTSFKNIVEPMLKTKVDPLYPSPPEWKPFTSQSSPADCSLQVIDLPALESETFYHKVVEIWNKINLINHKPDWQVSYDDINKFREYRVESILDHEAAAPINTSAFPWRGGFAAAQKRIEHYIDNGINRLSVYKDTRNGMLGRDYATKLSPYLALGCTTSREVMHRIASFEQRTGIANDSTYWVLFELLWRDYMRFYSMKIGRKIFFLGGILGKEGHTKHSWNRDFEKLQAWIDGKTGYPFVDACMRELKYTGYMSNRGRQVVASFLVRDLGLDWRMGAEYFEYALLDYDPCSNYGKFTEIRNALDCIKNCLYFLGNWQYSAGIGADPRNDRYFNIIKQGTLYVPEAEFV